MSTIIRMEFTSPWGPLLLGDFEEKLVLCDWKNRKDRQKLDRRIEKYYAAHFHRGISPLIKDCIEQLEFYAESKCKEIKIPYLCAGTDFQKLVWNALKQIPYGTTCSYKELAQRINRPRAVRAVASAVGANALSLIIPCHRVVGSGGELTGYAGGIEAKRRLLTLEAEK